VGYLKSGAFRHWRSDMFSRRLSAADLVALCRALRHQLAAGVTLVRVLQQQAERGPPAVRALVGRLLTRLAAGSGLAEALDREQDVLPPLFLALARLGDETGHFPEVLGELEQYYQLQMQLRRQFLSRAALPIIQFVLAVFIVAGVIFVLGMISPNSPLTFFGLRGGPGSLAFLATVAGTVALAVLLWKSLSAWGRERAAVDRMLLRVPALGPCLEALALGRFALALQLTLDGGLSIPKALRLSLRASGNAAYARVADEVARVLKAGQTLYEALALTGLFPEEFLQIIANAEEVGRVPEVMRLQAHHYHEEAARRMVTLTRAANGLVWLSYAGFMVWMIFKIAGVYLRALGV
jgi:type II secretory pathway component PulF